MRRLHCQQASVWQQAMGRPHWQQAIGRLQCGSMKASLWQHEGLTVGAGYGQASMWQQEGLTVGAGYELASLWPFTVLLSRCFDLKYFIP